LAGAAGAGGGGGGAGGSTERWLIWVPRHGLGNALRGFSSALLYALLSGRRFLRWHGGPHGRVLDRLCDALDCALDQLTIDAPSLPVPLLESHELLLHSLADPSPLLAVCTGSFFDTFWRRDKRVYKCVLDAFGCSSIWCVHSRTLALLLPRGPSERLEEELDKGLWSIPPLLKWEMEKVAPGQAVRLQFDLALHVRGRPSKVERVCVNGDLSCLQEQQQVQQEEQGQLVSNLLRPSRWHCIVRLAQFLRIKKAAALLAAAGAAAGAGDGAGGAAATAAAGETGSTAAAGASAGSSMSPAAPPSLSAPTHSAAASAPSPFAPHPESPPLSASGAPSPGSLPNINPSSSSSSSSAGRRRRLEEQWTVEESMRIATITPPPNSSLGTPSLPLPPLTIFIATDTDDVRPAIVKFLRPFGRVYFSNAPAIHLSKSRTQGSHLSTLGDFLMLSKASVVVSFTRYISTFAMFAAMLGNGTLVAEPESESHCRFVVEHLADLP
ncbi:hypothetical protein CLOM_g5243, partial [Closterium sp. NIES-68]